jgi:putative addiction module component (TIGR02574 family)
MNSKLLSQILDLPSSERIKLAQDIWDSVTEIPNPDILTDWQKEELKKRLKALDQDPNQGIPWKDVIGDMDSP